MSRGRQARVRTYVVFGLLALAVGFLSYAFDDDGSFVVNGAVVVSLLLVILAAWVTVYTVPKTGEGEDHE